MSFNRIQCMLSVASVVAVIAILIFVKEPVAREVALAVAFCAGTLGWAFRFGEGVTAGRYCAGRDRVPFAEVVRERLRAR